MYIKFIGYTLIIGIFLVPHLSLAIKMSEQCSPNGYTVATINGVFTDENGASGNMFALQDVFGFDWRNQSIDYQYLLNPTHLGGLGDIAMSVYQKIFENEAVVDYDLVEMLKSAGEKVKTQKLLLVAHSQGNFYANSFYDTVAGKQGGVPAESIGVYSVATPAGRVAGGGKWLTSDTDKVIAGAVGRVPFKNIMPPNTHIELQSGDDAAGHNFKDIYLKYKSAKIVSDIQSSLNRLSENTSQDENKSCLSAPELTLAHKIEGAILAVIDPAASAGSGAVVFAGAVGAKTAVWTYKAGTVGAKTAVWTYKAGTAAAKTAAQTVFAAASSITAAAKSLTVGVVTKAENNGAAVIAVQKTLPVAPKNIADFENKTVPIPVTATNKPSNALSPENKLFLFSEQPSSPKIAVKAMTEKYSSPKLVSMERRMSGISSSPPIPLEKIEAAKDEKTEPAVLAEAEEELSAPALNAPQCADSLAVDGCLLATTTARFEWAPVSGAFYYEIRGNGAFATTAETFFNAEVSDFSDYSFEATAVGVGGQKSATSAKTISVATIPVAINEIAWMGTAASPYDEWLELKNNTGYTISLSQWAVESKDGAPHIALSGSIAPREHLVLERRGDTIIIDSSIFTYGNGSSAWALGNGGEELVLSRSGTIFDRTPAIAGDAWAAGDNAAKKTMERYASKESGADILNWGTNLGFISNGEDGDGGGINGTPGARNSLSFLINKGNNVTENLTLAAGNGKYAVPNIISISASSALAIDPGAEIVFYKDYFYNINGYLNVYGILDARGTAENPIIFSSYSEYSNGHNGGVWFDNATGTSTLDNVRFENTNDIALNNSRLEISDADFINTDGGVNAFKGSFVAINNTRFANLTDDAIGAYDNSVITMSSTTIDGVSGGDGIGAYNDSTITIASTSINNIDGDGAGAYTGSVITIASTSISNVRKDGIGIYDNSSLSIASSSIKNISKGDGIGAYDNSAITIASTTLDGVNEGDGVFIYESTLVIASSTVKDVSENSISLYDSTSTISSVSVQDGGENGIDIYGGTTSIEDSTVSGFVAGVGVLIDSPENAVQITGGEIAGNSVGVAMTEGGAVIQDGVVRDNDTDIIICASSGDCP